MARQALGRVTRDWAAHWVAESAASAIGNAVNGAVEKAVRGGRQESDVQNLRLDEPAFYAQVEAQCDQW